MNGPAVEVPTQVLEGAANQASPAVIAWVLPGEGSPLATIRALLQQTWPKAMRKMRQDGQKHLFLLPNGHNRRPAVIFKMATI
jgi:hypothetical protein